jgi:predicted DNA-binding transcriptional regulator YafY
MKKKASKKSLPSFEKIPQRADADRRIRQADRLARLLKVLERLQSRGKWDAAAIAADLGVDERTVYRDLAALELAGVPWYYDKVARCYRLREDYRFPTLSLTDDELLGQAMSVSIAKAPGLNISAGPAAAAQKIAAQSERAEKLFAEVQSLVGVLDLQLVDHREHLEIIRTIQWALLKRKQVKGTYRTPYQKDLVRLTLIPYRLVLVKACWYVIARPHDRDAPRTYRTTRFQSLRMLEDAAQIPGDFELKDYFGKAWAVYRGDRTYQIELRFQADAAAIVTETRWHATQKATKYKDGSVTLHFEVDGLQEIANWIVGWSQWVKVISPPELRDIVAEQHRKAYQQYQTSPE